MSATSRTSRRLSALATHIRPHPGPRKRRRLYLGTAGDHSTGPLTSSASPGTTEGLSWPSGKSIEEVVRHLEITESTWHRWRNQYGGMKADDAKELRELRKENQRLRKIVADQALDNEMLKELNRGNF